MPISNDVKVTPADTSGGGPAVVIGEGVYNVEIIDITYISGEQNTYSGKPQLKFRFKIMDGESKDIELVSWVSMSLNPGWDKGNPSNLFLIAKAVMGEDPNPDIDFLPVWLMGGKLGVLVEERTSAKGTQYSKVTKYLSLKGSPKTTPVKQAPGQDSGPTKTDDELIKESIDKTEEKTEKKDDVPF